MIVYVLMYEADIEAVFLTEGEAWLHARRWCTDLEELKRFYVEETNLIGEIK